MDNNEKHTIIGPNGQRMGRALEARRLGAWAVALVLAVAGVFLAASLTTESSYWSRIVAWREARVDDFATKFLVRLIPNGPVVFDFSPARSRQRRGPHHSLTARVGEPSRP